MHQKQKPESLSELGALFVTRVESHARGLKEAVWNLEHMALVPDHKHLGMLNVQFTKDIQDGVSAEQN